MKTRASDIIRRIGFVLASAAFGVAVAPVIIGWFAWAEGSREV